MGGIADYSGSLVLQSPIAEAACCAAQCEPTSQHLRVRSLREDGAVHDVDLRMDDLIPGERVPTYAEARQILTTEPRRA